MSVPVALMVCRYKAQLGPVAIDLLKGGTVPFREF
jgi:hypothetical protein